jgi:uncharacterized protein (DUF58 family)
VLLVVLVALGDAIAAPSPRRLVVSRTVPGSVRLSGTATCALVLRSTSTRRSRLLVRDAWVPSAGATGNRHRLVLPAGEARRLTTPLRPVRRGDLEAAGVAVRSYGPLGLAARQSDLDAPARLRVLPEFTSRRHLPSRLARLREMDGRSAVQVRGEGTEFDSLRQYVIGDDVRSIDWRATARRSEVVVRTWRPERDRRVLIVLDTGRTSAVRAGSGTRLDAGIEAALLLAALASHAGDRVELVAFDRALRARVAGVAGARLLPVVADALSDVEPSLLETDWPGVVALTSEQLSQRALVVLVTALDPAAVTAGLLPVAGQLTSRHTVVLASVSPEPEAEGGVAGGATDESGVDDARTPDADVYDRAAQERVRLDRDAVGGALARDGVTVVQGDAEQLAPRLADTYLDLKAAGRL